ncbi:hypothetical protein ACIPC1_22295 [Streptomyces sp. NPDC087263]|uniref:hypothetical protein n=1 Tax=Streptomyces sp. NPDC087263 TaxID=3365773 RepID=UPI003803B9C4
MQRTEWTERIDWTNWTNWMEVAARRNPRPNGIDRAAPSATPHSGSFDKSTGRD